MNGSAFFLVAAALAWVFVAGIRPLAQRLRLLDRPGGHKGHDRPVPHLGGMAVAAAWACAVLVGSLLVGAPGEEARETVSTAATHLSGFIPWFVAGVFFVTVTGLVDDLRPGGLSPLAKLAGQGAGAILGATGGAITGVIPGGALGAVGSFLTILLVTNAFNLLDNMNGLAAGTACILCVSIAALTKGAAPGLAAVAAGLGGALCGFLPHNFPRARIFLGDAGSHLAGYSVAIGVLIAAGVADAPPGTALAIPAILFALPVLDVLWVVWRRTREGQPVWVGDRGHLSHRLVQAGHSPVRAVLALWACATWTAVLAAQVPRSPILIASVFLTVAAWVPCGALLLYVARAGRGRERGIKKASRP